MVRNVADRWHLPQKFICIITFKILFSKFYFRSNKLGIVSEGGARWPRGQCARCEIAEAKQRSQKSVLGWVTKIFYLELLRASEGTLSRWLLYRAYLVG
jgi:hypothetical protein